MKFQFKPAVKSEKKLRLLIDGPSGSGKTATALLIAQALIDENERVACIDTESKSASLYSGVTLPSGAFIRKFDSLDLEEFHPKLYMEAIHVAEREGYKVLVIDSFTHAWAGKGGALELHQDEVDQSSSGNSYVAWGKVKPITRKLIETILHSPCHIIATLRSKVDYVIDTSSGKSVPRKVGLQPITEAGTDYEFDLQLSMAITNHGTIAKTRLPDITLGDVYHMPGTDFAKMIIYALKGEKVVEETRGFTTADLPVPEEPTEEELEDDKTQFIHRASELIKAKALTGTQANEYVQDADKDYALALTNLNRAFATASAQS